MPGPRTNSGVGISGRIIHYCVDSESSIMTSSSIEDKSIVSICRVIGSSSIECKCTGSPRSIPVSGSIGPESSSSITGISPTRRICIERIPSIGDIPFSSGIGEESPRPDGIVS